MRVLGGHSLYGRGLSALGLIVALGTLGAAAPAHAQDAPAGSVTGHVAATVDEDVGGMLLTDLWFPVDWFRVGGFLGIGVIPSSDDTQNRVFMPVGASLSMELIGDVIGVAIRARGGLWAGATQEAKISAGGLIGGGVHMLVALGGGTTFSVGLDIWGLLGGEETVVFAPGLGLTWDPTWEPSEPVVDDD